ncbi:MAG: hypothetical protein FJY83_00575 [Candidatus Aminicenantes bacterium]|nr:hypothetical protein [Candidatus Aminicenantes bacterium]
MNLPRSAGKKHDADSESKEFSFQEARALIGSKIKRLKIGGLAKILGFILGLFVLSLVLAPSSRPFGSMGYYLLFFVLWPLLIYLIFVVFDLVATIFKVVTFGAGILAVILFLSDRPQEGMLFAVVAVFGLAVMLGIALSLGAVILGPGIVLGMGAYHGLGEGFFGTLVGLVVFVLISAGMYFLVMRLLLPFFLGFGVSLVAGALAAKISDLVFAARIGSEISSGVSRIRDLSDVLAIVQDAFRIGAASQALVLLGSIAFGIFTIVALWDRTREALD